MFTRVGQPRCFCSEVICGGGVQEGTMPLAQLSLGFQSLPPLPTRILGPSGADPWVDGFVNVLGPCGSLHELFCEAGSFSHCRLNSHKFLQSEDFKLYFCILHPWVVRSISLHICSFWFICTRMWDCPGHQLLHHPVSQALSCQKSSPPSYPAPPLRPVWMNVSSLTPWLSGFHTVQISVSSGGFLFLNLL